jgi:hypothetical protein
LYCYNPDGAGIAPDAVVLIPPRSLPKTTSGKVRRSGVKQALLSDALKVLYKREYATSTSDAAAAAATAKAAAAAATAAAAAPSSLTPELLNTGSETNAAVKAAVVEVITPLQENTPPPPLVIVDVETLETQTPPQPLVIASAAAKKDWSSCPDLTTPLTGRDGIDVSRRQRQFFDSAGESGSSSEEASGGSNGSCLGRVGTFHVILALFTVFCRQTPLDDTHYGPCIS